ncbi:MAG: insulinase family protein, partial [Actinomycetota bacterium]|nr:insulinase family protein [Actinomycetota bacterium]
AVGTAATEAAADAAIAATDRVSEAPQTHQTAQLPSGLRVVTERMPSVRSVAIGLWVRTGSRDEVPEQAGISHFLEHLLFKGTDRFSSEEIDQIFDGMGAEVNAGTGKETTSVYARSLDRHSERALEVIADMMLAPAYRDVDSERQVVIEEIAMYEDEPSDKVHDVLAEAVFGEHPLGRPIIGSADVVGSVPIPDIAAYHDSRYVGSNLVLAAAGNLEHESVVEQAERLLGGDGSRAVRPNGAAAPETAAPAVRFHVKETEQYHLALGARGLPRGDDRRFVLRVLDTLLGGSSSSRLFQEVREKRGLAYAVFSYASHFADSGQVGVYVGTRPDNVGEALGVIGEQLRRLQVEDVPAEELERAKENVKGRTVLSMESTLSRMNRLGSSVLMDVPVLSLDDLLAAIDAVSADDVTTLADELYAPDRMSVAGVGAKEETFRSALGGVSERLAAAA